MRLLLCFFLGLGSIAAEPAGERTSLLDWQITRLPASTPRMRANLRAYTEGAEEDVRRGIDLVLQAETLGVQKDFDTRSISIDGRATEWSALPSVRDARGDSTSGIDLLEFRAVPDFQGNLYVLYRAEGIQNKKREDGAGLNIRLRGSKWLQIGFDIFDSKQIYYNVVSVDGTVLSSGWIDAPFARGEVWEARIPLREILEKETIPFPELVTLTPFGGWKSGQDYGEGAVLSVSGVNHALELLLVLLDRGAFAPGDSISRAIALANSQLYAMADNETRSLIREDVVKHFALYQKVVAYQKQTGWQSLLRTPVIPKIYWADRRRVLDVDNGVLVAETYREFIDQIETLAAVHEIVRENKFLEDPVASASLLHRIDAWYYSKAKYRGSMENLEEFHRLGWFSAEELLQARLEEKRGEYYREYLGKRRRWDEFGWINCQLRLFQTQGYFKGDCGTATAVMMALYRMAGFAPVSFQKIGVNAAGTHNFPAYYNPGLKKWSFVQIQKAQTDQMSYLFYAKPVWHPLSLRENGYKLEDSQWVSANWQGEKSSALNLEQLTRNGLGAAHFEQLFVSQTPHAPGLLFNASSVSVFTDSDGDGLSDAEERFFRTQARLPDTDGDGVSDFWELDRGFSPLGPAAVPGVAALDGIVQDLPGANRVLSPAGDSKAKSEIFDVAELQGALAGDRLLLSVRYHNDVTQNKTSLHSFAIRADGEEYWVQWYKHNGAVYRRKGDQYLPSESQGLLEATLSGAEFSIPVGLLGGAKSFQVTYHAPGWFDGKEQITADVSGTISLGALLQRSLPARKPAGPALPPTGSVWLNGN